LAEGNHRLMLQRRGVLSTVGMFMSPLTGHTVLQSHLLRFKSDNTGVCCLFLLVLEQSCDGIALHEILFYSGDANGLGNLCLGCIWVMAARLLVSVPSWARESTNFFFEQTITQEHIISLCCTV
jgi:hypothetical protein